MCPQLGDAADGSPPTRHGVPAPVHVTVAPSPVTHTARTGVAVAVTDNPGTDAVAATGRHTDGSSHNHVGTNTNCGAGGAGFNRITGVGNRNRDTAS